MVHRARVSKVNSHPLGGAAGYPNFALRFSGPRRRSARPRSAHCGPAVPEMQETAHGGKKASAESIVFGSREKNRFRIGPAMLLFHGGHWRKPARQDVVLKAAGAVLHIRFEMKHRIRKLAMAVPRHSARRSASTCDSRAITSGISRFRRFEKSSWPPSRNRQSSSGQDRLGAIGIELKIPEQLPPSRCTSIRSRSSLARAAGSRR
jgi:hypothetical protein